LRADELAQQLLHCELLRSELLRCDRPSRP
jgi:hypothetical protein